MTTKNGIGVTNKVYAKADFLFKQCCELAGIEPTRRQASKFLKNKGKAIQFITEARKRLKEGAE